MISSVNVVLYLCWWMVITVCLFHAGRADAADGDAAGLDACAGLLLDLLQDIRGKLEPVDVADGAADPADEVRVRVGAEVEPLKPIVHADGIDGPFGLEHGKIAVDRGEREIGDRGLQLVVDPFRRRMAGRAAQTFQDRVALAAVLSDDRHGHGSLLNQY